MAEVTWGHLAYGYRGTIIRLDERTRAKIPKDFKRHKYQRFSVAPSDFSRNSKVAAVNVKQMKKCRTTAELDDKLSAICPGKLHLPQHVESFDPLFL